MEALFVDTRDKELTERSKVALFTFVQEFVAAILLFFIFYPTNCYIPNYYVQIALHFVSVIVFDIITFGAGVNPAITIGLYTQGILSLNTTIARHTLGGMLGYNLLELYYPYALGNCEIYGPQLNEKKSILMSGLGEAVLTFSFMLVVLNVIKYVKSVHIARPIYAVALRILLSIKVFYTAGSGNFNPMTAIAFLAYSNKTLNFFNYARSYKDYLWGLEHTNNYVTVFIISPVLGAVVATVIYATFNELLGNSAAKHEDSKPKKEEPVKKESVKESVKEPVNEPVKEPVKETTSAAATPSGGSTRKRAGSRSRK